MKSKDLEMGPFKIYKGGAGGLKMCKWFPLQLFVTGGSEHVRAELCSDREDVGSSLFHPSERRSVSLPL